MYILICVLFCLSIGVYLTPAGGIYYAWPNQLAVCTVPTGAHKEVEGGEYNVMYSPFTSTSLENTMLFCCSPIKST